MQNREFNRWRGLKALIHDAVDATTQLVSEGHESAARGILRVTDRLDGVRDVGRQVDAVRGLGTAASLHSVRWSNRAVERVTDLGLEVASRFAEPRSVATVPDPLPMRSDITGSAPWITDAALGAVNGLVGDHLHQRQNELDLSMQLRVGDRYISLDTASWPSTTPSPRVALFVHGFGTTEWSWCIDGEAFHGDPEASFGSLLERDVGFVPVYARYNTGRHVSENGRALSDLLERFVASYPADIDDLTLVGHSMGGLVVRSACHYALESDASWVRQVRRLFCLGSPHRGAPLAQLSEVVGRALGAIDTPSTRVLSKIVEGRSDGIKDLHHGALVDDHWLDPNREWCASVPGRFRAPEVPHYFVSASVTKDANHPVGRLVGDLVVRIPSASGPRLESHEFPITTHLGGVLHHQLQNHPAVYEQIRRVCGRRGGLS